MNHDDLEHLIRVSAEIAQEYDLLIVGSQSILGAIPYPAHEFKRSMEADMYPRYAPEKATKIEGAIGEASEFHKTHGYYAQEVDPSTFTVPLGWEERLCKIQNANTDSKIGWCLSLVDLFLSKAAAGRDKDREFCQAMLRHRYVIASEALELVPAMMTMDEEERERLAKRIRRWDKTK